MATLAIRLTPYRQARLAVYAERDAAIEALLRENPDGMTRGHIARRAQVAYDAVEYAFSRLERRGVMLCEDCGRISIYTED